MLGDACGIGIQRGMRLRQQRVRGHLHIAIDIAARRQRIDQGGIDGLHGGLQFALDHAMELERLARGDAQRMIGIAGGDAIQCQPLRGRDHPARRARADHELIRRFELLPPPLVANVAVVLLVAAVVLDQCLIVLTQRTGHRICQALFQRPTQAAAFGFDVFYGVAHDGIRHA